jgi:CheY-like chemotaxis protein
MMKKAQPSVADKKVVLIVDDDQDMRVFLSTLVRLGGCEPVTAKDGGEGMRKAKEIRPGLLILDVLMPGESGVRMYCELKTDPELKTIPVIMISAVPHKAFVQYLSMHNIRHGGSAAPPEAYLEKPPDAERLMGLIRSILEKADGDLQARGTPAGAPK